MEEIPLSAAIIGDLLAHCRSVYPEEGCGLIVSDASGDPVKMIPMANALHSPVRYQMDPRQQFDVMKRLRTEGMAVWAIFHSHPMSEPYPSPTDLRLAFHSECFYIIAGLATNPPVVRCFAISDGQIDEKRLQSIS